MNRRFFLQSMAKVLAILPFVGWLGKKQIDNSDVITRREWVPDDTIILPTITLTENDAGYSVRICDHDKNNDNEMLNIHGDLSCFLADSGNVYFTCDNGATWTKIDKSQVQPYANPAEVGYVAHFNLPEGAAFITLEGGIITVSDMATA